MIQSQPEADQPSAEALTAEYSIVNLNSPDGYYLKTNRL